MATPRKIPMHRGRMGSGSTSRAVPHPGTTSERASNFYSPFQPPPALADLKGDVIALDPNAWQLVHVAGYFWRVKTATPAAIATLTAILDSTGSAQVQAINAFLADHMHPDDLALMLDRMTDPDDDFGHGAYQELYRAAVTVGTARPFWQCSVSPRLPLTGGVSYGQNLPWAVWPSPSKN